MDIVIKLLIILIWILSIIILNDYIKIYDQINKLNNLMSNNTFIFNTYKCKCNIFFKCNNCKINNLINYENIHHIMNFYHIINDINNINIIIHTFGGECDHIESLLRILYHKKINIEIYVPKYALSAGSLLSLSGNKIHCNWYSLFSPIDTQIDFNNIQRSILDILNLKHRNNLTTNEYLEYLYCKRLYNQDLKLLNFILKDNKNKNEIIDKLLNTKYTHDYNYTYYDFKKLGLNIDLNMTNHINQIFNLFIEL